WFIVLRNSAKICFKSAYSAGNLHSCGYLKSLCLKFRNWNLVLGAWNLKFGAWCLGFVVCGLWFMVYCLLFCENSAEICFKSAYSAGNLDSCGYLTSLCLKFRNWNLVLGAWNLVPGIWCLEFEAWCLGFVVYGLLFIVLRKSALNLRIQRETFTVAGTLHHYA